MNHETELMLKQCKSGTETASAVIRHVLGNRLDLSFQQLLCDQLCAHSKINHRCNELMHKCGVDYQGISPVTRFGIGMHVKMKTMGGDCGKSAAHLLTDGCNTGLKQLGEYLNSYRAAAPESRSVAEELVQLEEDFMHDLRKFL